MENWRKTMDNMPLNMCTHIRLRSACTSVKSDQILYNPLAETFDTWLSKGHTAKNLIRLHKCAVWSVFAGCARSKGHFLRRTISCYPSYLKLQSTLSNAVFPCASLCLFLHIVIKNLAPHSRSSVIYVSSLRNFEHVLRLSRVCSLSEVKAIQQKGLNEIWQNYHLLQELDNKKKL